MKQMNTDHKVSEVEMLPLGEGAMIVEFGRCIRPDIHRQVKAFADYLDSHRFPGMIEHASAFSSVTVFYDPFLVKKLQSESGKDDAVSAYQIIRRLLQKLLLNINVKEKQNPRVVEIPVCYGGEFGPDLDFVAKHNQLSADDVIEIHTGGRYLVYMIGFAPGFPYLGGMSKRIASPRRQSPRLAIPAGSVGIAGMQTGVYPIETPGGWQLIGRTPLALFRPQDNPPSLLQSGDIIQFRQISYKEYEEYREGDQ